MSKNISDFAHIATKSENDKGNRVDELEKQVKALELAKDAEIKRLQAENDQLRLAQLHFQIAQYPN